MTDESITSSFVWRRIAVWLPALVVVVSLVMLSESARLIGEVLTADGRVFQLDTVLGPLALTQTGAWDAWAHAPTPPGWLIVAHSVVRVVFVGAYSALGWWILGARSARGVLLAVAALDLATTVLVLVQGVVIGDGSSIAWAAAAIGWLATLGWIALAALVVVALLLGAVRRRIAGGLRRVWLAGYRQRLSALVVIVLGITAVVPQKGVLEQVADVQRAWFEYDREAGAIVVDGRAVVAAAVTLLVVALWLFVLGRQRAEQFRGGAGVDATTGSTRPWFATAGVLALIGLALWLFDRRLVNLGALALFLCATLLVPVASLVIRRWFARRLPRLTPRSYTPADARDVHRTGDLLCGLLLTIAGFGLVRAFTAPVLLSLRPGERDVDAVGAAYAPFATGALVAGLVLGLASPIVVALALRLLDGVARNRPSMRSLLDPAVDSSASAVVRVLGIATFSIAILYLVLVLGVPTAIAAVFGPVGCLTLALGAWSVVLGAAKTRTRGPKPLELFQAFRLRSTPVLTLLVIVPVAVAQLGISAQQHAVQRPTVTGALGAQRPTLDEAFAVWRTDTADCSTEVATADGTAAVRPLVLAAAEGGGIRAATWTVYSLRELSRQGDCAASSVFLSSGVSGGAVGLAMFRDAADDAGGTTTTALSNPDALAVAVNGALVGDVFAGATGVRVPTAPGYPNPDRQRAGAWSWHDRMALMQWTWREKAEQLAGAYDLAPQHPTGYLLLNSTDAISGCKVLISQIDVDGAAGGEPGDASCSDTRTAVPGAIDLLQFFGDCPLDMDWATVAGLSARFPLISPAGRVDAATIEQESPDCDFDDTLQLIDGGYSDNSGLGTISDLGPDLSRVISGYNATADGSTGSPFVVPIVLYLPNESGADLAAAPGTPLSELSVPLTGLFQAPKILVAPDSWLTRLQRTFDTVCPPSAAACNEATTGLRSRIPRGTIEVAPTTQPAIEVPLGWALSDQSRTLLQSQVDAQNSCVDPSTRCGSVAGYGSLGQLGALFARE